MADQPSDKTLDSAEPDPSLTRNSSLSKLNAKAPEFVPMKTPPPSPSTLTAPPPLSSVTAPPAMPADPRMMIVPPPPPPPPAMVHFHPPTPMPVIAPPPLPHMHHHHHQQQQHHPHHHNHEHHQNHRHNNRQKRHDKEQEGQSQGQGGQQNEKDQGQENGASRNNNNNKNNNNGLSEEATQKLINQVEYYFSDVNLATTDHLIRFIFKDPEGFVPISVVASFKKIKALIGSNSQLAAVLRNSTKLAVSEDGKKVKRLHPLASSDMEELQARIVVAENLPEDHCHQNLMKIFSAVGSVKSIRTCQPQPSNNGASSASRQSKTDSMLYSNKVHAFVEYETVELAEKAIAELNDEDSWRNGLRLRSLLKHGSKPAQGRVKKTGNEGEVICEEDASTSEQNQNEKQSDDHSGQPDTQSHEHGEEQSLDKEGGQKKSRNRGRGKGRGRGHNHHHQTNRGSHVGGPPMSNAVNGEQLVVAKQQPPGPRMPDGTKGFSMGRGRPLAVNTA